MSLWHLNEQFVWYIPEHLNLQLSDGGPMIWQVRSALSDVHYSSGIVPVELLFPLRCKLLCQSNNESVLNVTNKVKKYNGLILQTFQEYSRWTKSATVHFCMCVARISQAYGINHFSCMPGCGDTNNDYDNNKLPAQGIVLQFPSLTKWTRVTWYCS